MKRRAVRWPEAWSSHGPFIARPPRRLSWVTATRVLLVLSLLAWALMIGAWLAVAQEVWR